MKVLMAISRFHIKSVSNLPSISLTLRSKKISNICMYISQFTKRGYDSYSIGAKIKNIKFKVNELDPNNGYLASGWTKHNIDF